MSKDRESVIIRIGARSDKFRQEMKVIRKQTEALEGQLKSLSKISAVAFAGLAVTTGGALKAFATFEQGLIGVGKTTNIQGKALKDFGKEIQQLGEKLPITQKRLLEIAQAAGQLGVEEKNLIKFTDTIAKLGTAANISGEEAALALTRILTVTNEGTDDVDRFASVIVELGNNFAATEAEIVAVTTRVAQATARFNVSSKEAAGLATALRAVGVQAELGGSVIGRAFEEISNAIRGGGKELEILSTVIGKTGEQIEQEFGENAVGVFQEFLEGLNKIGSSNAADALEAIGLKGIRINQVLPVLIKNTDLLGETLSTASAEFDRNTALQTEFEAANKSLNSEVIRLRNSFNTLLVTLGEQFVPTFSAIISKLDGAIDGFNNLDDDTKAFIATAIELTTALTGLTLVLSTLSFGFLKLRAAVLGSLGTLRALGVFLLTNPLGLAITAAATLAVIYSKLNKETGALTRGQRTLGEALDRVTELMNKSAAASGKVAEAYRREAQAEVSLEISKRRLILSRERNILAQKGERAEALKNQNLFLRIAKLGATGTELRVVNEQIDETILKINKLENEITGLSDKNFEISPKVDLDFDTVPLRTPEELEELQRKRKFTVKSEADKAQDLGFGGGGGGKDEAAEREERIQAVKDEIAVIEAERKGASDRQVRLLSDTLRAERDLKAAQSIEDDELRALEVEKAKAQLDALAEQEEQFKEDRKEIEAEIQEVELELEATQNEEAKERLLEQLTALQELRDEFLEAESGKESETQLAINKIRQKGAKEQIKIAKAVADERSKTNEQIKTGAFALADSLVKSGTGASKALFIARKAFAIGETIINAQQAASLAIATIPPPAGEVVAAQRLTTGAIQAATIAAQSIPSVFGAQDGGVVPGQGFGDRVPFQLEPGELIVPRQNFNEVVNSVAAQRGLTAAAPEAVAQENQEQTVTVEISLTDDASQLITAAQREDQSLGIEE